MTTTATVNATAEKRPGARLSRREAEVMALAAEGLTSRQIARRLFVSKRTVDFHLGNVYEKLGAAGRVQAVLEALRRGMIPAPSARQGEGGAPVG